MINSITDSETEMLPDTLNALSLADINSALLKSMYIDLSNFYRVNRKQPIDIPLSSDSDLITYILKAIESTIPVNRPAELSEQPITAPEKIIPKKTLQFFTPPKTPEINPLTCTYYILPDEIQHNVNRYYALIKNKDESASVSWNRSSVGQRETILNYFKPEYCKVWQDFENRPSNKKFFELSPSTQFAIQVYITSIESSAGCSNFVSSKQAENCWNSADLRSREMMLRSLFINPWDADYFYLSSTNKTLIYDYLDKRGILAELNELTVALYWTKAPLNERQAILNYYFQQLTPKLKDKITLKVSSIFTNKMLENEVATIWDEAELDERSTILSTKLKRYL